MNKLNICPACNSANTRRCALIYDQGVSTTFGASSAGVSYTSSSYSGMVYRFSPPSPPTHPSYWWKRLVLYGGPGVVILSVACIAIGTAIFHHNGELGFVGVAFGLFACNLLWRAWPPKLALSPKHYRQQLSDYFEHLELYERLWACTDCAKIFLPNRDI